MIRTGRDVCAFLSECDRAPGLLELCDSLYSDNLDLRSELWRQRLENREMREQIEFMTRSKKVARRTAGITGHRR